MSRVCTRIVAVVLFALPVFSSGAIVVRGVRPVRIGEERYKITCTTTDSADLVEWRRIINGQSVLVKPCPTEGIAAAAGAVCSCGEISDKTLRFGSITFNSAGLFSCIGRYVDKIRLESKYVTVSIDTVESNYLFSIQGKPTTHLFDQKSVARTLDKSNLVAGSLSNFRHTTQPSISNPINNQRDSLSFDSIVFVVALVAISVLMTGVWLCLVVVYLRHRWCKNTKANKQEADIEMADIDNNGCRSDNRICIQEDPRAST